MSTILVTGATGLLGNNVTRWLMERGQRPRVLIRAGCDPRPLAGLDVEAVIGDVTDPQSVREAVQGCSAVVHAAGNVWIGWSHAQRQHQVNVDGTRHVIEAAQATGAFLVHVSSINALGVGSRQREANEDWADANIVPCPYVTSKQQAERLMLSALEQGLNGAIVNPGFMLGPWDWKPSSGQMVLQVAKRWTPLAPWGGVSVCDVRDVASAIGTIIEGRVTGRFVLGGENLRYVQLWRQIAQETGSRGPWFPAGPLQRIIGGAFGDLWTKLTGVEPEVNSAAVRMSSQFHYFSSERAERELNYKSRPARESIRDAWRFFQEHGFVDQ